jgi:hypothetical protein
MSTSILAVLSLCAVAGATLQAPSSLLSFLSNQAHGGPLRSNFRVGRVLRVNTNARAGGPASGSGSHHRGSHEVEDLPPCAQAPPLAPVPSTLPNATIAALAELEAAVQNLLLAAQATGGHATLVYDQTSLWSTQFGTTLANGAGANVSQDTVFRIGSITKVRGILFQGCKAPVSHEHLA